MFVKEAIKLFLKDSFYLKEKVNHCFRVFRAAVRPDQGEKSKL